MPYGGQSEAQGLNGESQPAPRMVRVAAALFVTTALLVIFSVALNWFLKGHAFEWTSPGALLAAALNVLVAVKLLQLRYWALILAQILTLWLAVGFITLFASGHFASGQFVTRPPVVKLATLAEVIVTAALLVTLFVPSVRRAFRRPDRSESI